MLDYIIIIYWLLIYLLLFFGFNMSKNNTIMLVAFIHATIITALSSIVLYSYDIQFNRPNMLIEIIISKLSFWYFINDLILLLIFDRDLIYIIHHLCASITLYTTLNMGFGLSSCMLILFLGEITNPFRLAKQMIYEHNKITYSILNFIFSWLFLLVRCIAMTYYYILMINNFIPHINDQTNKYTILVTTTLGLLGGYGWSWMLLKKKIKLLKKR